MLGFVLEKITDEGGLQTDTPLMSRAPRRADTGRICDHHSREHRFGVLGSTLRGRAWTVRLGVRLLIHEQTSNLPRPEFLT